MSTDDWTPSAEQVRSHYVFDQTDKWDAGRGAAFDRWLSGVKAAAWDEGFDSGEGMLHPNPYRRASE